ncbi:MAG: hypothetical protein D6798_16320 [Deltaproteobacteria bacterium]|nr:MAG: hypothetical protein D6798_16320 [Deltaproteobacteria bacterium]
MLIDLQVVKGLNVCAGMDIEQATSFFEQCRMQRLAAGAVLSSPQHADPAIHFVRAGELAQFAGSGPDALLVRTLIRGDLVATSAIVDPDGRCHTSLRALKPCTVLTLDEDGLDRLMALHHPVVANTQEELLRSEARELEVRQTVLARFASGDAPPRPSSPFAPALRSLFGPLSTPEARWTPASESSRLLQRRLGLVATPVEDLVAVLSTRLEARAVARGEVLQAQGRAASAAFVVRTGKVGRFVRSEIKGHVQLDVLTPGQLGGFETAILGGPATASAVALEDGVVLRIRLADLAAAVTERTPEAARIRRAMLASLSGWQERIALQLYHASIASRAVSDGEVAHASAS